MDPPNFSTIDEIPSDAVKARIMPATLFAASIALASTPLIASKKFLAPMPNAINCKPSIAKDACPRLRMLATPDIKPAPVRTRIAADKYPAPATTLESTLPANSINGCTPAMNADNAAPSSGRRLITADPIPATTPPAIPPTNFPIDDANKDINIIQT